MRRRRPRRHTRVINGKKVLVNKDVVYGDGLLSASMGGPQSQIGSLLVADSTKNTIESNGETRNPNSSFSLIKRIRGDVTSKAAKVVFEGDAFYTRFLHNHKNRSAFIKIGAGDGTRKFYLSPGNEIPAEVISLHGDLSNLDLRDTTIHFPADMAHRLSNFESSTLDGSNFVFEPGYTTERISFEGASLRDVKMSGGARIRYEVNLKNADLTGADFGDLAIEPMYRSSTNPAFNVELGVLYTEVNGYFFNSTKVVDVRGSNISSRQIAALSAKIPADGSKGPFPVRYDQYTATEAQKVLGVGEDDMMILLWAGDIEVRDNETKLPVTGTFDKDKHHIPQWEMQRLRQEAESGTDVKKEKDLA